MSAPNPDELHWQSAPAGSIFSPNRCQRKDKMSRKPVPAQSGDRSRIEVVFDRPQLLGTLFGQYDQNLVSIENRLGVYILARGNKLQIEGEASAAARARD